MQDNKRMREWSVYVAGKYVGTVFETTEEYARCAALGKYDIPAHKDFSVNAVD